MFHRLFGVPHVDGVYWTLEVELLFYCGMLLLFALNRLDRVFWVGLAGMALKWVYFTAAVGWGIELSWTIHQLFILNYMPWFVLGIAAYALIKHKSTTPLPSLAVVSAAVAILTLFGVQSVTHGVLGLTFFVLVLMAANGMLPVLRAKPLVWLGSVSYPLYLLHENIGWSLIHWGLAHGLSMNTCVAAALAAVLLLSHAVSRLVEQPTMQWIRTAYRIRKSGAATT